MSDSSQLQELAREVRADTVRILAAANELWLTWSPPGTSNHILWHAGHALWLQDLMCVEPLSGISGLPDGWADMFGMNTRPEAVTSGWPSRSEVLLLLHAQLRRMLDLLNDVSGEQLAGPVATLGGNRNLYGWIIHGLHDEAKHCGEMYLLWKLCNLNSDLFTGDH